MAPEESSFIHSKRHLKWKKEFYKPADIRLKKSINVILKRVQIPNEEKPNEVKQMVLLIFSRLDSRWFLVHFSLIQDIKW